ncbi:MAG: Bax inhibitor-1/YccA family protein [Melioribacteraceae bacterium]|jgi:FtsH-binding integral membrane protein|nr:Bax inhibitor-1/YccA family protein [Melioribacteraceae bacterium]
MNSEVMNLSIAEVEERSFISKVYRWMGLGLILTALTAYFVVNSSFVYTLAENSILFYGLIIAELGLVIYLSTRIQKMSAETATAAFIVYSVLNGVTLSLILLIYTGASVASTFLTTALTFGAMSAYGYFTKRDLTSMRSYLMMGLVGLIIASVINMFWANSTMYWIISYAGVLLFVGLTAYDTQKIKKIGAVVEGVQTTQKMAIMGALTLYLDFINLFLFMLRILGNRK